MRQPRFMVRPTLVTMYSSTRVVAVAATACIVLTVFCRSSMAAPAAADRHSVCGRSTYSWPSATRRYVGLQIIGQRLVGGVSSMPSAWPWTVQILWSTGKHCCGAALIGTEHIVSAAHCFAKKSDPSNYKILLGGFRFKSGVEHSIVNITVHPLYNVAFPASYDIAVARFDPPAVFSESIRRVCLPGSPILVNTTCVVTGWGHEHEKGNCSTVMKQIKVPILADKLCNDSMHYDGRIYSPTMMCAGYDEGGVDACQGDSGGPLFCQSSGQWELHGLVSWGVGCARPKNPGVYTKVAALVPWIKSQMD